VPLTTDTHAPPTRRMVALAALAAVAGAVVVGTLRGAASAVLWLAFAALAAAVMLFWETLRLVLDPQAPGDPTDDDEAAATEALSARKRSALRALKELEFERSLGRISEEDFQGLSTRYRAEARDAMAALDAGLGRWRDDAATLLERAAQEALTPAEKSTDKPTARPTDKSTETTVEAPKPATRACPQCTTHNDLDAVFCKKCGTRMVTEPMPDTATDRDRDRDRD
jgi:ribosomal protein L40E